MICTHPLPANRYTGPASPSAYNPQLTPTHTKPRPLKKNERESKKWRVRKKGTRRRIMTRTSEHRFRTKCPSVAEGWEGRGGGAAAARSESGWKQSRKRMGERVYSEGAHAHILSQKAPKVEINRPPRPLASRAHSSKRHRGLRWPSS